MTIWNPQLSGQGPLYRQLAQAIGQAVEQGELQPGQRLPTHRALADQLGVTVGTITRAASISRSKVVSGLMVMTLPERRSSTV